MKINSSGGKVWDKRFGGTSTDYCFDVTATSDGGYLLAGRSNSGAEGDKSEASRGNYDMWAVKINASGAKVWDKRFGGSGQDLCGSEAELPRLVGTSDVQLVDRSVPFKQIFSEEKLFTGK